MRFAECEFVRVHKHKIDNFIDNLRDEDRASLMSFNTIFHLEQEWTNNWSDLKSKIDKLTSGGGTSVWKALDSALYTKMRFAKTPRALILLSDGVDNNNTDWDKYNIYLFHIRI